MTAEEAEARRWEALQASWTDDAAHRGWLDGFADLDGLARAGQRYRAWLVSHPGDPIAKRWLEEVVKRATVRGLASLPRSKPPPVLPRWLKGTLIAVLSSALAWGLYAVVRQLLSLSSGR